ncbi:hypothetical protein OR62_04845 [Clostridium tetani]|uniref:Uncharacterized protein n=1 Tax=Clostridium tetani TaxID=1513 RepID=A0ABY0ENQ5_CLOTA|nr:hypothetical protein OR62_04845 [Clostridium tetani]RXI38585.1 hypothetical protein DP129_10160 [Clostridium tetani]RXI55391.1 hypothetical protein DP131_08305 [Clostridium tetani]RXI68462.1 hypothetical protein DQN76_09345 [Clostridium tetani]
MDTDRLVAIKEEVKINKKLIKAKEKILEDIRRLQLEQNYLVERGKTERVDLLKEFKQLIKNPDLTWEEQNELYKTIMYYITYIRVDDEIKMESIYKQKIL